MFYLTCELADCDRFASSSVRVEDDNYRVCDHCFNQIQELQHIGVNDENTIRKGVMTI